MLALCRKSIAGGDGKDVIHKALLDVSQSLGQLFIYRFNKVNLFI